MRDTKLRYLVSKYTIGNNKDKKAITKDYFLM